MPTSTKKRQYNCTQNLKKKGFKVDGRRKTIFIYITDVHKLIANTHAIALVHEFNFTIKENNQLRIF